MKKLISLAILIIFITGCSPNNELQVSTLVNSKEKKLIETQENEKVEIKNFEVKKEIVITEEIQTYIDFCKKQESFSEDECLYNRIYYKVYDAKDNIFLCELLDNNSEYYSKCLWIFAMQYTDPKICERIKEFEAFEGKALHSEDCKKNITYENNESRWNLKSGDPYLLDPGPLYEGESIVQGWVFTTEYFDSNIKLFHISKESLKNLPEYFQDPDWDYSLKIYSDNKFEEINEEILKDLEKYTETSPATIKINAIRTRWEMPPVIGFVEILNP